MSVHSPGIKGSAKFNQRPTTATYNNNLYQIKKILPIFLLWNVNHVNDYNFRVLSTKKRESRTLRLDQFIIIPTTNC